MQLLIRKEKGSGFLRVWLHQIHRENPFTFGIVGQVGSCCYKRVEMLGDAVWIGVLAFSKLLSLQINDAQKASRKWIRFNNKSARLFHRIYDHAFKHQIHKTLFPQQRRMRRGWENGSSLPFHLHFSSTLIITSTKPMSTNHQPSLISKSMSKKKNPSKSNRVFLKTTLCFWFTADFNIPISSFKLNVKWIPNVRWYTTFYDKSPP